MNPVDNQNTHQNTSVKNFLLVSLVLLPSVYTVYSLTHTVYKENLILTNCFPSLVDWLALLWMLDYFLLIL